MRVVRVAAGDAARLKRVRLAALEDTPSAFGSTFDAEVGRSDAEWSQRAVAGSHGVDRVTFFAQLDDEVVGLVGGYRDEQSASVVELVSMWVAPQVRGRGVGARLVDAVTTWARETNATNVSLWVTRGNTPAERLYESCGFAATGELQPLPWDQTRDEIRMVRPLDADAAPAVEPDPSGR
ncbi:MAG: GNAT family N-acetyltransferase [Ilumatobacteraceae bacterium]